MNMGQFEISGALAAGLQGSLWACVREVGGIEQGSIVRSDQEIEASGVLTLEGSLVEYVCGSIQLDLVSELIGPGPELVLATVTIPLQPAPMHTEYPFALRVAAATLTSGDRGQISKLAITAHYRTPLDRPGPAAGFVEGFTVFAYPVS